MVPAALNPPHGPTTAAAPRSPQHLTGKVKRSPSRRRRWIWPAAAARPCGDSSQECVLQMGPGGARAASPCCLRSALSAVFPSRSGHPSLGCSTAASNPRRCGSSASSVPSHFGHPSLGCSAGASQAAPQLSWGEGDAHTRVSYAGLVAARVLPRPTMPGILPEMGME